MKPMTVENLLFVFAGAFILISLTLSHYHSTNWLWFTAFVGINLFQTGFTGFCPLAIILRKLGVPSGQKS